MRARFKSCWVIRDFLARDSRAEVMEWSMKISAAPEGIPTARASIMSSRLSLVWLKSCMVRQS